MKVFSMKRTLLAITAFAVILTSCQKEAGVSGSENKDVDRPTDKSVSFKASILSTKTTLNGNSVYWSENDRISINGEIFTATTDGATTTFTREDSKISSPYVAMFPSSLAVGDSYVLPAVQTYSGVDVDNLPMFANSNDRNLVFSNLCGVLGVTIKSSDMASVKSIKVSCSNVDMHGTFTVEDYKAVLSQNTGEKKSVVLECSQAVSTAETGTTFYIALPEAAYENLTVELSSDGGNYTKTMNARKNSITVASNTIYPWNFLPVGYYPLSEAPTVSTVM